MPNSKFKKTAERYFTQQPTFGVFGDNVPSRAKFVRVCKNVIDGKQLSVGDKFARHLTAHWGNSENKVAFSKNSTSDEFQFKWTASVGEFFSISWAINDEILQQFSKRDIISIGFDSIKIGRRDIGNLKIYGNLNLVKGKEVVQQTCDAGVYEGRLQASFNMSDNEEVWAKATRGWMDIIFANPRYMTIKFQQPMIWVQSKMDL